MKILITGNLGYVGPGLVSELRAHHPDATLVGFDTAYFARYVTGPMLVPEHRLDLQYYGDVREFPEEILEDVDTVVSLAAISNDPIGNKFEQATLDINYHANLSLARKAKAQGVNRFVFASSCSVYGAAEDAPRTEDSEVNPLTAYAKSKVYSERDLEALADDSFMITCLRFATACGMSDRLRLDLVVNDFVACAVTSGEITILSDGSPWRPLIHVRDMARAIRWGHERSLEKGGSFVVLNTGSNAWNYQVKDLALAVKSLRPGTQVSINENAAPDKRSYRVNFDLFEKLAPDHQPQYDLAATIRELMAGFEQMRFSDHQFRNSHLMRLNVVNTLVKENVLNEHLRFSPKAG